MTPRGDAARAAAKAMGWEFIPGIEPGFERVPRVRYLLRLPAPDAPLSEHLAFVGRLAEELGVEMGKPPLDAMRVSLDSCGPVGWNVWFRGSDPQSAPDPSWAALLAVAAAKAAR